MDIKVHCYCGQDFAFEAEPVNGVMPCTVNCPACGSDGTQLANRFILESQGPPPPPVGGLRISNTSAPAQSSVETASTAVESQKPQRYGYTRTLEPDKAPPPSQENIPMGIIGGLVASLIAMGLWYALTVGTGSTFGIVAWFVGVMAGLGVRVLGRDGSPVMGYIAAVCACMGILGGQLLVTGHYVNLYMGSIVSKVYDKQIAAAHEAVNLKTDSEIMAWLQKENGKKATPVSQKDVEEFKSTGQAKMQSFVDEKPSRAEYEKLVSARLTSFSARFEIFKRTLSFFTVLWLIFGIVSAFRIGSG